MTKLLLVRHGITEFNSNRRFCGYSDIELSATGYKQVERLRGRLADEQIDAVYCSDLRRAVVTAEIISSGYEVDIVTCSELREINYGDAEGLTFDEIDRLYPELAESITNFSSELNFPGGESFDKFTGRVSKFSDQLDKHAPSETILIVSHGGPIRTLVCHLLDMDQSHWRQISISNASLSIVEVLPQGAVLSLLNDTSHLSADI